MRRIPLRRTGKSERSKYIAYLDYLWGTIVIVRDGRACIICGGWKLLAGHHVYSKTQHSPVRYDTRDGVCLCFHDHQLHHNNTRSFQAEFDKHINKTHGAMSAFNLEARAHMRSTLNTRDLPLHEMGLMAELLEQGFVLPDGWKQLSFDKRKKLLAIYRRQHAAPSADGEGSQSKV